MYIYKGEQIRDIDREAEQQGLSPFTLMENAGRGLFEKITPLISRDSTIGIVAGQGNNGGDGIVLARYLRHAGYDVSLMFPIGKPTSKVANAHLSYYLAQKYDISNWNETLTFDVIVDSLLGVGTRLPIPKQLKRIIAWANSEDALRIAIDMPTGVLANEGRIQREKTIINETDDAIEASQSYKNQSNKERINKAGSEANDEQTIKQLQEPFKADYTFSLHGAKPSAFLYPSSNFYGKLGIIPIGLAQTSQVKIIQKEDVIQTLPNRISASHKGTFGSGLLVAGTDEMPGSVTLSAIGAIRSGIGRLMIATSERAIPIVASFVPEATFMANGLERIGQSELPEKITAAGIGPGLTDSKLTKKALEQLMNIAVPLVVDAGALEKRHSWRANGPIIITPHPGEFSRLTGYSIQTIEENRIELAAQFSQQHNVIIVLKGEYTVVAFPNGKVYMNQTGNTGLAKGGSGDVLTGILVSFLATHNEVEHAVTNAVYIHGLCANEWATQYSEASMTASDFTYLLPKVLKDLESNVQ